MAEPPADINRDRWVKVEGQSEKFFLLDSRHTFRGLMHVVADTDDHQSLSISKSQVTEASEAASHWIDGFLAGTAPSISEYLGWEDGELLADEGETRRWTEFLRWFRDTGGPWVRTSRPSVPVPSEVSDSLPHLVWHGHNDPVWFWNSLRWTLLDRSSTRSLPAHDDEGHHMNLVDEVTVAETLYLWICEDCGYAEEVERGQTP